MKRILGMLFLLTLEVIVQAADAPERFVQVSGEGEVKVEPDIALTQVQIETTGKDLKQVEAENVRKSAAVLDTLKKLGVATSDIQTTSVQISPRYDYVNGRQQFREYGASKSFSVKLRDLSAYGKVINGLIQAGVGSIGGVQFASSKQETLEAEARKKAALDAKTKAEALAAQLGVKMGKVISIVEEGGGNIGSVTPMRAMAMSKGMPEDTLSAGEITVTAHLTVKFELQ